MFCNEEKKNEPDLELQRVDTPENIRWKSCCLLMDKDFVIFFTKYFIITGLLTFFAIELHISDTCEETNLYQSLMLLMIGVAIPNPKLK